MVTKAQLHYLNRLSMGTIQILAYLLIGYFLADLLNIPGAIIGLILCAISCILLGRVPRSLELVSRLLLNYMGVLFIPFVVAIVVYWPQLADYWIICLFAIMVSSLLSMVITAKLIDKTVSADSKLSQED